MNGDRWGRTQDELDDHAKHSFATGAVLVRAVADKLSEITYEGNPINRDQLDRIHGQLYELWLTFYSETLDRVGPEPTTGAELMILDAYDGTYSDGSPVSITVQHPDIASYLAPAEFYTGDIPPDPPLPPGCEVIVNLPPHDRMRHLF
jgi:hypothetical protein